MITENTNASPAVKAVEAPKPFDEKIAAVPLVTTGEPVKAAEAAEQKPVQKPTGTNAVPQPQLGMPMFKRRADPGMIEAASRMK